MSAPRMLVVGAAPDSLGAACVDIARHGVWDFESVVTAGLSQEEYKLDATMPSKIHEVLADVRPDILVCTVGENTPCGIDDQYLPLRFTEAMVTNVLGPLELLRQYRNSPVIEGREGVIKKFVAVSSNSARIPRRGSLPYCASKAALSMALRVAAREIGGDPVQVWGYEPGLLAGTPMTQATEQKFDGPLHRMIGVEPQGIPVAGLAQRIINDVAEYSPAMNGVIFPFDAGEL